MGNFILIWIIEFILIFSNAKSAKVTTNNNTIRNTLISIQSMLSLKKIVYKVCYNKKITRIHTSIVLFYKTLL